VRAQVEALALHTEGAGRSKPEIQVLATEIASELSAIEVQLIQVKNQSHQDPLNYPPKLKSQYAFLYGYINGTSPMFKGPVPPTDVVDERLDELNQAWIPIYKRLQDIVNEEVAQFNQYIHEMDEVVFIPK